MPATTTTPAPRFREYPLLSPGNPGNGTHEGTITIYHKDSQKCACKGSGLVPPPAERIGKEPQSYCPVHKATRYWPQTQKDGSTKFFELGPYGLTNKEMPR